MGIIFRLINYNKEIDQSMVVQQRLAYAFRQYGYNVAINEVDNEKEFDIYIITNETSNDEVKIILANQMDITQNNMSYYDDANKYYDIDGDIAAIIITGEITQKVATIDMNYYFSPMVYVHMFNKVDIDILVLYLIRRYGGVTKIFYEIGDL